MNVLGDGKYNILNAFLSQNYPRERKTVSVVVTENTCQLDFPSNDINREE